MSRARQIEAGAVTWLMRREEPGWSAEDENALQSWLAISDAHKAAYWRLEHGWRRADRLRGSAMHTQPRPGTSVRPWYSLAAAASLLIACLTGVGVVNSFHGDQRTPTVVRTVTGGHRQVKLADGTTVELNTATVIRTSLSSERRDVWLDQGEAFFSVKKAGVPFAVHAGNRTITVVGTKFSVSLRDRDDVRVSVVEGRVRVSDSAHGSDTTITAGDMLQNEGSSTLVVHDANKQVDLSLSWRQGLITFDGTSLTDAAREFNRYNDRKLVIHDDSVAAMRIGGSFKTSNSDGFARLLHEAYGLQVAYGPREIVISR